MQSYQIVEYGKPLEPRVYETPRPVGTEVLVRVHACGVCHTDLHLWSGYYDLGGGKRLSLAERGVKLPFTMGHEIVGEVVACGPDARGVEPGMRAVVYPWIGCGQCAACRKGADTLCPNPRALGARRDGGYSDHVIVPHPRYLVDYGNLDPAAAATCACSGLTAYSAIRKLPELSADESVLIIGAGGVGLAAVGLAAALLPAQVIVADISPAKRAAALDAGAAAVIDSAAAANAGDALREASPQAPSAVIDFVGSPETMRFAIDRVARGGTVIGVGLFGGELPVSLPLLPLRMLTIRGSYVGSLDELRSLVTLLKTRMVPLIPVATRPLSEVNAALADLSSGRVVGRVVLRA